jgi:hypothetical protein
MPLVRYTNTSLMERSFASMMAMETTSIAQTPMMGLLDHLDNQNRGWDNMVTGTDGLGPKGTEPLVD